MKRLFFFTLVSIIMFGCTKQDISPQTTTDDDQLSSTNRVLAFGDVPIAKKIDGIVVCTVDEDILQAALVDHYGATTFVDLAIGEHTSATSESFYALTGRVKDGKAQRRFAFELIPFVNAENDIDLYLSVAGTEQNVTGPGNSASMLHLTSASTGYAASQNSVYTSTTSVSSLDDFGTNKLLAIIIQLL